MRPRCGGLYVPALYKITYREDGTVQAITPLDGAPERITKRIVTDWTSPISGKDHHPLLDIVHDRVMLRCFGGFVSGAAAFARRDTATVRSDQKVWIYWCDRN